MSLPWTAYLPILAGILAGLIGGYYHKKRNNKK